MAVWYAVVMDVVIITPGHTSIVTAVPVDQYEYEYGIVSLLTWTPFP